MPLIRKLKDGWFWTVMVVWSGIHFIAGSGRDLALQVWPPVKKWGLLVYESSRHVSDLAQLIDLSDTWHKVAGWFF